MGAMRDRCFGFRTRLLRDFDVDEMLENVR